MKKVIITIALFSIISTTFAQQDTTQVKEPVKVEQKEPKKQRLGWTITKFVLGMLLVGAFIGGSSN